MSTVIYDDKDTGLNIRRFCGPVRSDGGPRERYMIRRPFSTLEGTYESCISLNREEMLALVGPLALRGLENPVVPNDQDLDQLRIPHL